MLEKVIIPILVAILAIFGSLLVAFFTPGSFLIHPVFEIDAVKMKSEKFSSYDVLKIENKGWPQARNVQIEIISDDDMLVINERCIEDPNFGAEYSMTHKLKIDRVSSNLECKLGIAKKSDSQIYDVIITADNSPAYERIGTTGKTSSLSNPLSSISSAITMIAVIAGIITAVIQQMRKF